MDLDQHEPADRLKVDRLTERGRARMACRRQHGRERDEIDTDPFGVRELLLRVARSRQQPGAVQDRIKQRAEGRDQVAWPRLTKPE